MKCLRCGVSIPERQCFCAKCKDSMEAYPVKPDVNVRLPVRKADTVVKKTKRQAKPEEIIARQQRVIRRLAVAVVVLMILVIFSGIEMFQHYKAHHVGPAKGQNYETAVDSTAAGGK